MVQFTTKVMTEEKRYKIVEQTSTGWALSDSAAQNLTRDECNQWIRNLLNQGANPNDFKAVFQEDERFDNRMPLT